MALLFAFLAVATAFIASSAGNTLAESRDTTVTLPPLTPAGIISLVESVGLIQNITAFITVQTLVTNTLSIELTIENPLPVELTLDSLAADAGLNGTIVATFMNSFASPGFVVPALSSANSGTIDNVALPEGAIGLVGIIPFGILDLTNISASLRALSSSGSGGIPVPLSGLTQTSVPTEYALASCAPS